ncbi:MAG: radical SAM protein [Methylococcaceae bacterium]
MSVSVATPTEQEQLILDGTKIAWHKDRVDAWLRGERIAPITIDMALTRACNYRCVYCYATLQENERKKITQQVMYDFLEDCAEMDVKAISLVSDGESTLSPVYADAIQRGGELGIDMASGSNGFLLDRQKIEQILPHLTYFRVNITAGEPARYAEIMGTKEENFHRVVSNIKTMVEVKRKQNLSVTIGLQMVLMPEFEDQILPLAKLGQTLGVDYLVIKHCSDDEEGSLGVDYEGYERMYQTMQEAESYSKGDYKVIVKWSKIKDKGGRRYQRCYGPPFIIQISGSGLVAPCGMLFNDKYNKYHIGNIAETRFKEIWQSDRYWDVMNELASPRFNAQSMCGSLCLQHKVNEVLDDVKQGQLILEQPKGPEPGHLNFI